MRLFYFVLILLIVLFFVACSKASRPASIESTTASNLTYTTNIKSIFQNRCSQCHNSNWPDKNWMDYDTAYKNRIAIKTRVANQTMPPGNSTGLTKEERSTIVKWIDEGAKK
jgi:uncharacterized membrane protein